MTTTEQENMQLMQTLDDAWNARDLETFAQRHDGKEIPPTGKSFEVDFCTVARWDKGQIVGESLL